MKQIILILFLTLQLRAQVSPAGKSWSFNFPQHSDHPGDTIVLKAEKSNVNYGIYFQEDGSYSKMTGWKYCGTAVLKHHILDNPKRYENGTWAINTINNQKFLELQSGQKRSKYRILKQSESELVCLATNDNN